MVQLSSRSQITATRPLQTILQIILHPILLAVTATAQEESITARFTSHPTQQAMQPIA
jgi:hypothetical protein